MDWRAEPPDHDSDPLDPLLQEARWAEPSPDTIRRLRESWKDLQARRSRRRRRALAALAGAALAVTSVMLCMRSEHKADQAKPVPVAVSPSPRALQGTPRQANAMPIKKDLTVKRPALKRTSRPPNPYERLVLAAYRRTRRDAKAREQFEAVAQDQAAVAAATNQPEDPEQARADRVRRAARLSDSRTLGRLIQEEQAPELRRELLAVLLARGDPQSVEVFLERIEDSDTSSSAFDSLASASHLPTEALLRCLHSPLEGQRLAAARVLGRLNQPAISRELIAMVVRGVHRQEAMIALLASSEAIAQEFLASAARNPALSVALWNAKRQFQTAFPRRS